MRDDRWSHDWPRHFRAMERWKTKALENSGGKVQRNIDGFTIDSLEAFDYSYTFFVWAHSLRDWLIGSRAIEKRKLDEKLNERDEWRMVRDFSNRVKHQKITRNPTDAEWISGTKVSGNTNWPPSIELENYVFHNGNYIRLDDCINRIWGMWVEILKQLNLSGKVEL